jgi:hypothetical protein
MALDPCVIIGFLGQLIRKKYFLINKFNLDIDDLLKSKKDLVSVYIEESTKEFAHHKIQAKQTLMFFLLII